MSLHAWSGSSGPAGCAGCEGCEAEIRTSARDWPKTELCYPLFHRLSLAILDLYVMRHTIADADMESQTVAKSVSCVSCAERKVRCDRLQPCSHCKRRKEDNCVYPMAKSTPLKAQSSEELAKMQQDRIYELEPFILRTGGDPNHVHQRPTASPQDQIPPTSPRTFPNLDLTLKRGKKRDHNGIFSPNEPTSFKTREAHLVEHDKQTRYIETCVLRSKEPKIRSLIPKCSDLYGTAGARQEGPMERQRRPSRRGAIFRNDKLNLALATIPRYWIHLLRRVLSIYCIVIHHQRLPLGCGLHILPTCIRLSSCSSIGTKLP